jgi:two-component system cell cycle response regulator
MSAAVSPPEANLRASSRFQQSTVSIDLLTGAFSPQFMQEMAAARFSEARRHRYCAAVVCLELDGFGRLESVEGRAVADEVLVSTVEFLRGCLRREDMLARFDQARFVILMMHCDGDHAMSKTEALRQAITTLEPAGCAITVSAGVAAAGGEDLPEFEHLLASAAQALAEAARARGNQVRRGGRSPVPALPDEF